MTTRPNRPHDAVQTGEVWVINARQTLTGVHLEQDCEAPCPLHAPSDHSMRSFVLTWRNDRDMFERQCDHGVGHPDPDNRPGIDTAHGCDGCCGQ